MGLFDKKYCDVCGEKIGLLGNRKLEDGNLCSKCAKKLSPLFSDRRRSTVDEIKEQLKYREENELQLQHFNPVKSYGDDEQILIDVPSRKFVIANGNNWRDKNPDIIDFSQVTLCNVDIREEREELLDTDSNGNERSYNPPRFKYEYRFYVNIQVNSPWFSEIEVELTGYNNRPENQFTEIYRQYERDAHEIVAILTGGTMPNAYQQQPQYNQPMQGGYAQQQPQYNQPMQGGYVQQQPQYNQPMQGGYVQQQPQYNQPMQGSYAQPQQRIVVCDKCGWQAPDSNNPPKFCPMCGDPIDFSDLR